MIHICLEYVWGKASTRSKQLACKTSQNVVCRPLEDLVVIAKIVDDDLSLSVLKVLDDLRTNHAFTYWQHVSTKSCGQKAGQ